MKKMYKQLLKWTWLICFCMFFMHVQTASASDGWGSHGDNISWTYTESKGELKLTGKGAIAATNHFDAPWMSYEDGIKTIVIGEGITSIPNEIFNGYAWGYNCYFENLTTVKLPSTLKSIGDSAFYKCGNLKSVNFPSGLESIGRSAFYSTALTSVILPDSVTSIGSSAFSYIKTLKTITLGNRLETIPENGFSYSAITSIKIPASVKTIGGSAFAYCNGLTSVTIPSTVTYVDSYAFKECTSLRTVYCDAATIEFEAFGCCPSLEVVQLGNNVLNVNGTFRECNALKAIYVPSTSTSFSDDAFWAWNAPEVTVYTRKGSNAWTYVGTKVNLSFADISNSAVVNTWKKTWNEAVNRKPASETTETEKAEKKKISKLKVTAKKGTKKITIKTDAKCKLTVSCNKKILKKGSKTYKKITINKCSKSTVIKLSKKLKKNMKITVKVTKSGYTKRTKTIKIK